jgi:hypothetical protein
MLLDDDDENLMEGSTSSSYTRSKSSPRYRNAHLDRPPPSANPRLLPFPPKHPPSPCVQNIAMPQSMSWEPSRPAWLQKSVSSARLARWKSAWLDAREPMSRQHLVPPPPQLRFIVRLYVAKRLRLPRRKLSVGDAETHG